jgi:hypothetical protein
MARLNLEYKLLSDPRFKALSRKIGERLAIGEWVAVAMAAQDYWAKDKSFIPPDIWELNEFSEDLIRCHLVERKDEGYYLKGSEEYFNWYLKMLEFSKKGVEARKIKAEKRAEDKENELLNLDILQHTVNPSVNSTVNSTVNLPVNCTVNFDQNQLHSKKIENNSTVNSTVNLPVNCTVNPPTPTPYNNKREKRIRTSCRSLLSDEKINQLLPGIKSYALPTASRMTEFGIVGILKDFQSIDLIESIEELHNWIEQEGKKYKSIDATIRNWLKRRDKRGENSDSRNHNRTAKVNNGSNRNSEDTINIEIP